ncbi:sigma-70 family RNA polymerase sigma factor [Microbacterium sp. NEAU-LLC]|uniref:Sigma-70 family RNA polymerase sigma factor n=1 Tax=Microbacterium helvum TaxID=2773713 RepID=A0ABR8NKY0_9MICO|nr:sigma-70 family RNA polymerase sigma factor [Microbacterium helvum]MBD3941326.1 sigma-70 family RNA polymerase sigma factor [Microbacterium helvum]
MDGSTDTKSEQFRDLFAERYGAIVRFCERRIADREVARDLADECFTIAWEKLGAGVSIDLPWLYTTAKFLIANQYRKRVRARAAESLATLGHAESNVEDRIDTGIDVREALRTLSHADRELLYLLYWDGLTTHQAASVMNVQESTLRVRAKRARDRLAGVLANRTSSLRAGDGVIRELG